MNIDPLSLLRCRDGVLVLGHKCDTPKQGLREFTVENQSVSGLSYKI